MNQLLLLAYHFPPIGGAGVQRPAAFARYLPDLGYEPIVITGPGTSMGRWTPHDPTLSAEIPHQTKIIRVSEREPLPQPAWRNRAERWLRLRSDWHRWWTRGAVSAGVGLSRPAVVYAVMSPWASAEAAAVLAKELDTSWIADLGDPWALDEMMVYPSGLHRRRELERMRRALASAAAIVMSTPEAVRRVRERFPELADKPIVAIPNGFDAADFEGPVPARNDGKFRIVHTGYLHTELGRKQHRTAALHGLLGGEVEGVDILTRSHVYLLKAIERLIERDPSLRSTIELHLAGVLSESDREVVGRSEIVRLLGYLPHADSVALLRSADLLFLPMQNLPPGRRATIVPGKTYEYLAAGPPILAAVPEGDARDILSAAGNASICAPDDADAMAGIIQRRLDDSVPVEPVPEHIRRRFDYVNLVAQVAEIIDDVAGVRPVDRRVTLPLETEEEQPRVRRRAGRLGHLRVEAHRRVLFVAYHFPPIGGAGVQRSLKFVRYLPEFGYRPAVVTGPGTSTGRWTPRDTTLSEEIPFEAEVHRVTGPEPEQPAGWRARAERWLRLGSDWDRWWVEGAVGTGRKAMDIDLVHTSMSPYASAEAAARLAASFGKPWIAGLRDPWALDEMMVYPTGLHRRRELERMRRALASAAAIVMNTPEAVRRVRERFPELADKPIVAISNGFDAADFEGPVPARNDGKFRIVHTGYLHTELGRKQHRAAALRRLLGGEVEGVDILTRSHVYLLEAIERLIERDPSLRSTIELHLAGVLSESDREVVGRSEIVRLLGYLPHADSVALLRSADLLFLPMQNLPPGRRATIVPGKTYEYLAAGPPILAAAPEGDARDMLIEAGNSFACRPNDVEEMTSVIASEIARWQAGIAPPAPSSDFLAPFERRHLASELAQIFDEVLGRQTAAEAATPRSKKPSYQSPAA